MATKLNEQDIKHVLKIQKAVKEYSKYLDKVANLNSGVGWDTGDEMHFIRMKSLEVSTNDFLKALGHKS